MTTSQNTLKTETVELDEITFATTQFGAMRGFKLMARLLRQIGPAMGALTSVDPNTDLSTMGPVLVEALQVLDPEDASKLVLDILAGTTALIDGKTVDFIGKNASTNFDLVFNGRLPVMFKVVGHALKTHYADFSVGDDETATPPPIAAQS